MRFRNISGLFKETHSYHGIIVLVFLVLGANACCGSTQRNPAYISKLWVADRGNGTYKNPTIYADHSDPDVIRVAKAKIKNRETVNQTYLDCL